MEAATDPPWDRFLYFPLPLPEFDLEYTTDLDLQFLETSSIIHSLHALIVLGAPW